LTPLPGALGGEGLVAWRLEKTEHFAGWQDAEGAFRVGGRWSSPGHRVIYASLDPATTIVEVAVHKGFNVLDSVPHTLLSIEIKDPSVVQIVKAEDVPNRNWLVPGVISKNQQEFCDALLSKHPMLVIPSVVSSHSWNLLINTANARGLFALRHSEQFALDTRLTPGLHARAR
jgi:RES domain-containing protein